MSERAYQLHDRRLLLPVPQRESRAPVVVDDNNDNDVSRGDSDQLPSSSSSSFSPETRAMVVADLERWGVVDAGQVVDRFPIEAATVLGRLNELAVAGRLPKLYSPGGYVMRCIWREAGVDRAPRSVLPEVLAEQEEAYLDSLERRRALG